MEINIGGGSNLRRLLDGGIYAGRYLIYCQNLIYQGPVLLCKKINNRLSCNWSDIDE